MNAYILGAGASKAYKNPKNNLSMPLAKEVFKTYNRLSLSANAQVLIGDILNYLRDNYGINEFEFCSYNEDIEKIHSEIHTKLVSLKEQELNKKFQIYKAHQQLIFLFASIINEIQNGPVSSTHIKFVNSINEKAKIITFNWDTLLDRALVEADKTNWKADYGYCLRPEGIYNDGWRRVEADCDKEYPQLIKLHGSTNWLVGYFNMENQELRPNQNLPYDKIHIFENSTKPYPTYRGRYWADYAPFSYGYYPVNLPIQNAPIKEGYKHVRVYPNFDKRIIDNPEMESGIVSMPVIIPPIKEKQYDMFGSLFDMLWDKAENALVAADKIFVIGYSFPNTDTKSKELFSRAFFRRETMPKIIIINPHPEDIVKMFLRMGVDSDCIEVHSVFFDENFDFCILE